MVPLGGSYTVDELREQGDYQRKYESQGGKRKYALIVGYVGTNYSGLQMCVAAVGMRV
jgi:hypothetical protein